MRSLEHIQNIHAKLKQLYPPGPDGVYDVTALFETNYESIVPRIFQTKEGTYYFKSPGVALIGKTALTKTFEGDPIPNGFRDFINQFDKELGFDSYLEDDDNEYDGAQLTKMLGQLCYLSFGENRTKNADIQKYIDHIKSSGHGSVTEHASYTFLLWGVSRSFTHELVRHRLASYSQVSQRYVDGKSLRFVKRPEYKTPALTEAFETDCDAVVKRYDERARLLLESMADELKEMKKTDARKRVNQAARSLLPNETEAPIGVTMNVRSWRHFLEQRGSIFAEIEARRVANAVYLCLSAVEPHLFSDYQWKMFPDGTAELSTPYRKI